MLSLPTMRKKDVRWKQRFSNFKKALSQFEEALVQKNPERLAQEGLIQRFEYTFELAWKCLQDLLQERGLAEIRGPKPVLEQAFQDGLITDGLLWMEMLKARNEASHIYDEKIFLRIYNQAKNKSAQPFRNLKKRLDVIAHDTIENSELKDHIDRKFHRFFK